ncbi:tRNA lysidine(34) synthetase TilS [uncultured Sphingomonas sp.]|uniref:tRNA lysidine(34) synthetase TilS n=1 Tax=uncultured Sphingomonas sp. TaxID=158754 RepID=UPI0025DEEFBA|nr:tRNA lysidine(34) synthetase TilS [uncultured Sphingomonas sp.]
MSPPSASNLALIRSGAIDPAAVARFADDLGRTFTPDAPLLVAVSGGPDSVALLLLAHHVLGNGCVAATVDHGLRKEAADEARWVADLCAGIGVPHTVLTGALPTRAAGTRNLSARARALRYALLRAHAGEVGAAAIATAHHADDQVETIAMRLNRGAGLSGLAGVRAGNGDVIRPLLGWRRDELAAIVAACGITPVDDPSNRDARFARARVRAALEGAGWIDAAAWSRSASALADADEALAWVTQRLWDERCSEADGGIVMAAADLPFDLRRRLVARCVLTVDPAGDPRGSAIARGVAALDRGATVTLGEVLCRPSRDARDEPVWRFVRARSRRSS